MERDAALARFEQERRGFEASFATAPDEALRYVPRGEDYTLGGLVVHVSDVLIHYALVLDRMRGARFEQVRVVDPEDAATRRRKGMIGAGYDGAERAGVLQEMRSAHDRLAAGIRSLAADEYTRKAPVLDGADAEEPYATGAGDILGWVSDHYREHADQIQELLGKWRARS
jgi:hypothetical protein